MTPYEAISWAMRASTTLADEGTDIELALSYLRTTADHLQTASAAAGRALEAKRDDHPDAEEIAHHAGILAVQLAVSAMGYLATSPFIAGVTPPDTEMLQ